jgi:hypothetical protein
MPAYIRNPRKQPPSIHPDNPLRSIEGESWHAAMFDATVGTSGCSSTEVKRSAASHDGEEQPEVPRFPVLQQMKPGIARLWFG